MAGKHAFDQRCRAHAACRGQRGRSVRSGLGCTASHARAASIRWRWRMRRSRCAGAPHVVVVTIDHGLQPASAEVAAGVAAWAREQGASGGRAARRRRAPGSLEAAARTARFACVRRGDRAARPGGVLLAHTQRDQAETVLMRIVRGTGPAGLAGMAVRRGPFVRPLLDVLARGHRGVCPRARAAGVGRPDEPRSGHHARPGPSDSLLPAVRSREPGGWTKHWSDSRPRPASGST